MGFTQTEVIKPEDCYTNGAITNWYCSYFDEIGVIILLSIFILALASVLACSIYYQYWKWRERQQIPEVVGSKKV